MHKHDSLCEIDSFGINKMHISIQVKKIKEHQKIHFIISNQDDSEHTDEEMQEFLKSYSSKINSRVEEILKQVTEERSLFENNSIFLFKNIKKHITELRKHITDIRNREKTLDLLDVFEKRIILSSYGESIIGFTRMDIDGDVTTFFSEKGKNRHFSTIHHINVRFSEFLIYEKFSRFMISLSSISYLIVSIISSISLISFGVMQLDPEQCYLFNFVRNQESCLNSKNYWQIFINMIQLVGIPLASIFARKKILQIIVKGF